jgi:hypothetical protein
MVVWVDDCSRLVDATIAQAPNLLAAARRDPRHGLPSIVPVADKVALFRGEPVGAIRATRLDITLGAVAHRRLSLGC